jgi:hypothetical protein
MLVVSLLSGKNYAYEITMLSVIPLFIITDFHEMCYQYAIRGIPVLLYFQNLKFSTSGSTNMVHEQTSEVIQVVA